MLHLQTLVASAKKMEDEITALEHTVYKGPLVDDNDFPRADVDVHAVLGQRQRLSRLQNDHKELMARIERGLHDLHATSASSASTSTTADDVAHRGAGSAGSNSSGSGAAGTVLEAAAAADAAVAADAAGGNATDEGASNPAEPRVAMPEEPPFALVDQVSDGTCSQQLAILVSDTHRQQRGLALRPCKLVCGNANICSLVFLGTCICSSHFPTGSPAAEAGLRIGDQVIRVGTATRSVCAHSMAPVAQVVRDNQGAAVAVVVLRGAEQVSLSLRPRRWAGRGLLGCHLAPMA